MLSHVDKIFIFKLGNLTFLRDILAQLGILIWYKHTSNEFSIVRIHLMVFIQVFLNYAFLENTKLIHPKFEMKKPIIYLNKH